MNYETLLVTETFKGCVTITLNRPTHRNTINAQLLKEFHQVLDQVEKNSTCRVLILSGQPGFFCTGMDFQEMSQASFRSKEDAIRWASHYMSLLKRFALSSKIIIAHVEGEVTAGGVGLVAASDMVIAHTNSQFTLSEALWGLLPANVLPYLIRRVGFQKAYLMTLTTQKMLANEALACHLVDEVSDQPHELIRRHLLRLIRLDERTIYDLKTYFRKLWMIDETMEQAAIEELARLIQEPRIQSNIKNFVEQKKFPWEQAYV